MKQISLFLTVLSFLACIRLQGLGYTPACSWAAQTLNSLTLEQKIAQLVVIGIWPEQAADGGCPGYDSQSLIALIQRYQPSGVLLLGHGCPEQQLLLTHQLQAASSVPLLIVQDCEWGPAMRLDGCTHHQTVRLPQGLTLGAIADSSTVYEIGYEIGMQCRALGITINLAPVADVIEYEHNPTITRRAFGSDPERVAVAARAYTQGMQDAGMKACAKHFPGHGGTAVDSHLDLPVCTSDMQQLHACALRPFTTLIKNSIDAVMTGHLLVPAIDQTLPASVSPACVTDLLRNRLGFSGLCITDALNMQAITHYMSEEEAAVNAFLAGNHIILCPPCAQSAIDGIVNACRQGRIMQADIDQRVMELLSFKERARTTHVKESVEERVAFLTRPEAYRLQEKAYQQALTLVHSRVPEHQLWGSLSQAPCMLIGVSQESELARMCATVFTSVVTDSATTVADLLTSEHSTIVMMVTPHSGDRQGIDQTTIDLIHRLQEHNTRVIVVLFGSPSACRTFTDADVLLVAYEDCPAVYRAVMHLLRGHCRPMGLLPICLSEQ